MSSLYFFFSNLLTKERLSWMLSALDARVDATIFLTGDAGLACSHDKRLIDVIAELKSDKTNIVVDENRANELNAVVHGLQMLNDIQYLKLTSNEFWTTVIRSFSPDPRKVIPGKPRFGFMLLDGPYQNRASVHAINALTHARDAGFIPDLFLYLDGVHAAHVHQKPTTFINIGDAIHQLAQTASTDTSKPCIFACARCGTARGYASQPFDDGITKSIHAIPEVDFVNLNEIIKQFQNPWGILSTGCALSRHDSNDSTSLPAFNVIVTHSPYGTEHAYGAVSMAMAAAMNYDIPTNLIFIEDGSFCVSVNFRNGLEDQLYDIPGILRSIRDEALIHSYVYKPSMVERRIGLMPSLDNVIELSPERLGKLLVKGGEHACITRSFLF
ncbi:MAG: DsrE family protein [Candidatus Sigynarchaeota archaeon]